MQKTILSQKLKKVYYIILAIGLIVSIAQASFLFFKYADRIENITLSRIGRENKFILKSWGILTSLISILYIWRLCDKYRVNHWTLKILAVLVAPFLVISVFTLKKKPDIMFWRTMHWVSAMTFGFGVFLVIGIVYLTYILKNRDSYFIPFIVLWFGMFTIGLALTLQFGIVAIMQFFCILCSLVMLALPIYLYKPKFIGEAKESLLSAEFQEN